MRTALFLLALLALAPAARAQQALDGTEWKLKYAEASGPLMSARVDYLMFDAGKMASARMIPKGFEPTGYDDKFRAEEIEWRSRQRNADGLRLEWEGKRSGDAMEGTVRREDAEGNVREYRWKATLNHPGD